MKKFHFFFVFFILFASNSMAFDVFGFRGGASKEDVIASGQINNFNVSKISNDQESLIGIKFNGEKLEMLQFYFCKDSLFKIIKTNNFTLENFFLSQKNYVEKYGDPKISFGEKLVDWQHQDINIKSIIYLWNSNEDEIRLTVNSPNKIVEQLFPSIVFEYEQKSICKNKAAQK